MADHAKEVNPFKNEIRPESTAPSHPPNAPNASTQPVVPVNDFTGG
jgi:hypothetical protein